MFNENNNLRIDTSEEKIHRKTSRNGLWPCENWAGSFLFYAEMFLKEYPVFSSSHLWWKWKKCENWKTCFKPVNCIKQYYIKVDMASWTENILILIFGQKVSNVFATLVGVRQLII